MDVNEEAWAEWCDYRSKEKRKKIGPRAETKQRRFLAQYPPETQQIIVDQSIMNSWQGLFAPKEERKTTRRTTLAEDLADTTWAN